jgi:uncharacterized OsmC-like protein
LTSDLIDDAVSRFRAEPATAQLQPAVTATLTNGRASLTGGPFTWESDLPPMIGGGNAAPSPTAYFLGALAGCAVAFIYDTLAPQFDVQVDSVSAVARCRSDLRGLLGMDDIDARLTDLAIEISIDSPSPSENVDELRQAWVARCPIYLSMIEALPVNVIWTDSQ